MKHSKITECINCQQVRDSLEELRQEMIDNETKEMLTEEQIDGWEIELRRLISFFN